MQNISNQIITLIAEGKKEEARKLADKYIKTSKDKETFIQFLLNN